MDLRVICRDVGFYDDLSGTAGTAIGLTACASETVAAGLEKGIPFEGYPAIVTD
jgi:hypothetical protein